MGHQDLIQVLNIAPTATLDQLRTLFGYLGRIEDLVLYPTEGHDVPSKVAFIRFHETENPGVALHLNNTVFIDRALIVIQLPEVESLPDEATGMRLLAPALTTAGVTPRATEWPANVISMVVGRPGEQLIQTYDNDLPTPYPALPATTDANRIEEIRRTVLLTHLEPHTTGDQVIDFLQSHGDIKFVRMAQSENDYGAFVEFAEQPTVGKVLALAGSTLNGRQILVQHATCCIIKPASVYGQTVDTGTKKAKEAQDLISGSVDQMTSRSRSRSRGSRRRRSRTRSRERRRRSRSRDRDRRRRGGSRERSDRHRRDRDRRRSRSRSRDRRRRRSRTRSKDRRKRNRRSRSRERKRSNSRSRGGADRKRGSSRSKGDKKEEKEKTNGKRESRSPSRGKEGGEVSGEGGGVMEGPEPPPATSAELDKTEGQTEDGGERNMDIDSGSGAESPVSGADEESKPGDDPSLS